MPMNDIRNAATIVRNEFDDPYALATRRITTDGVAVFVRLADRSLVRARDRQHAIKDVLENYSATSTGTRPEPDPAPTARLSSRR
jgi:hypothetical protein